MTLKLFVSKIEKRTKTLISFFKTPKGVAVFLVLAAVAFNAIVLWPEVAISVPSLNDEVLHIVATREVSSVLGSGRDPTDFWLSQIGLGYPLFHHYQHLPQIVLAVINRVSSFFISLPQLFNLSRYLLLVFYPLSIFWAMRRFGFNSSAGGIAALVSSLISTNGLFGLEYGSYIWRGAGLYLQLWAMFFLPLALSENYQAICKKGRLFWPVFLSVVVLLSNLIYGYVLLLSSVLFVFLQLNKKETLFRLKRFIVVFFLVSLATSYFLAPFFLDRLYLNRSVWEADFKYNSFGAFKVLKALLSGNLFDYGRLPVLTIFFFLGMVLIIIFRRSEEHHLLLLGLAVFWLLLYFGRPAWGSLLNVLPFSQHLHLHRLIGGFHLAATMVIGAGGALCWEWIRRHRPHLNLLLLIVLIAILSPAYIERLKFCQENKLWRTGNQKAFLASQGELSDIKQTLEELPPGRVFAGMPNTWGNYPYYRIGFVPFYAFFTQWGFDSFGYAYHAEALADDVRLHFDDTQPVQYNLFNIRYVLLHKTWAPPFYYYQVKEFKNYILYQIPTTGYFDLVDASAVFYGLPSDFYSANSQWLFSLLPELKQHPILELGGTPQKTFGFPVFAFEKVNQELLNRLSERLPPRGNIIQEDIKSQSYGVRFEAFREAYLMLKANYHPDWQVYVDGKKISPVMLAPGFIGVRVEPGTHEAFFYYKPPAYRLPLLIFGILVLSVMFFDSQIPFIKKLFHKILMKARPVLVRAGSLRKSFRNFAKFKISNRSTNILAFALLTATFFLAIFSLKDDSATLDEVAYIPAGFSYLSQKDYRLDFEHPPLAKDLAAIPLLLLNLNFPKESPFWTKETNGQWGFGPEFLYLSGNDPDEILFYSRVVMVLVSIFLSWFLFKWARELATNEVALMVLVFSTFSPNLLAHGRLATLDVAATLGAVLSIYFYLKFLRNPGNKNILLAGLSLGVALLVKFSLVLLLPFFTIITFVWIVLERKRQHGLLKKYALPILAIGLIVIAVIWLVYQFHLWNYPAQRQIEDTKFYLSSNGINFLERFCLWMAARPGLRPFGHYLLGFLTSLRRATAYTGPTYFLGKISFSGWWYYFPAVYFLKVPLALHIFSLGALFVVLRSAKKKNQEKLKKGLKEHFTELSMGIFLLIYWLTSINSKLNTGIRHVLPTLPFIYILVALGVNNGVKNINSPVFKRRISFLILILLGWYIVSSLAAWPHYLSYFNEIIGGSKNGYKYVVDSNCDWGQDLKRLAQWVDAQNIDKIYVDYFGGGGGDVQYYLKGKGILWYGASWWRWQNVQQDPNDFPMGNYLAVSATFLQGGGGGPTGQQINGSIVRDYEWLDSHTPVARIGDSIFIYYIDKI